jgi:EEF1A lysine methyltransferase 4
MSFIAENNAEYKSQEYWESRFTREEEYDWLMTYADVQPQIERHLKHSDRILVIGCGNSKFSSELYDAGYHSIVNIDYSEVVINRMKEMNAERKSMQWVCMDMTQLTFHDSSFDVVIDKAAMDAIMVDEGSVWDPDEGVIQMAHKMCQQMHRVLTHTGTYLQISFAQPHFRTKYLMGLWATDSVVDHYQPAVGLSKVYGWTLSYEAIVSQKGTFDNYLYCMQRKGI